MREKLILRMRVCGDNIEEIYDNIVLAINLFYSELEMLLVLK